MGAALEAGIGVGYGGGDAGGCDGEEEDGGTHFCGWFEFEGRRLVVGGW